MVMRSGSGRTRSTASPPGISGRMCLVTLGSELLACSPHVPIGPLLAYRHHAIRGRTSILQGTDISTLRLQASGKAAREKRRPPTRDGLSEGVTSQPPPG